MSKYIPHAKQVKPKWLYLANPKTGEVKRIRLGSFLDIAKAQKDGFYITNKAIFKRYQIQRGPIPKSFTPSPYPSSSQNYVYSNVYFK